ncbi:MAG TPA: folate-binding protein [Caulobacteraceae bacterium]
MTAAFATLGSRALVRVAGPDWRAFLQGLVSNDVERLEPGAIRFAALLTPQGRVLFDLFIVGGEQGCLLDVHAARREALVQRLSIYRLRAKVEIAAAEGAVCALWNTAAAPEGWARDPRLAELGFRGVDRPVPAGAERALEDAYDAVRLGLGAPDPARDAVPDKTYPIEADMDLLNGIDFQKGCYVGQETTSRMKRRGGIRSRMLPIRFEGPPPPFGAEVLAGDLRAGEVLSGREGVAMALLRLDRIEAADLTVGGRPVRAAAPGWLTR